MEGSRKWLQYVSVLCCVRVTVSATPRLMVAPCPILALGQHCYGKKDTLRAFRGLANLANPTL